MVDEILFARRALNSASFNNQASHVEGSDLSSCKFTQKKRNDNCVTKMLLYKLNDDNVCTRKRTILEKSYS